MTDTLIHNVKALQPGQGLVATSVLMKEGLIAALDPPPDQSAQADRVDGGGRLLTPGLIDMHTHGIAGERYDNPACVAPGAIKLARYGTTTAILTLSGRWAPGLLDRLNTVATAAAKARGVRVDLLNLEGPFLALPGAGGEGSPGDVHLLKEILSACRGQVKAMCVSPDTENILPVIETMVANDVRPFITHTRANVEQTQKAIDAGARHATHFYDVFHLPADGNRGVRPVGAVEAILADPRCTVDFICDGVHVHPTAIACTLAAKGYSGVALITDANSGAGRAPGIYDAGWGTRRIQVCEEGGCRVHAPGTPDHGILTGSALTMNMGIRNLRRWFDLPDEQIWAMGTSVPAAILGLTTRGVMQPGAEGDLVLWDETGDGPSALRTWVGGKEIGTQNKEGANHDLV